LPSETEADAVVEDFMEALVLLLWVLLEVVDSQVEGVILEDLVVLEEVVLGVEVQVVVGK
jgi:hypothetical protein